jgi:hypothetical protein
MPDHLKRLRWVRRFVRAVLAFGILISLAANVLGADPHPISQAVAAWAPLALLLAVELVSRTPVARRGRSILRITGTVIIAGIAGWVSYWHQVEVAIHYGEAGLNAYLLPFSVDGLIVVASVTLVELGDRIRTLEQPQPATVTMAAAQPENTPAPNTPAPKPVFTIPPHVTNRLTAAHHNGNRSAPTANPATGTHRPDGTPVPAGNGIQEPLL